MKFFLSALMIAVLSIAPGMARAADNIVGVILEAEGKTQISNASGTYDATVNTNVHPQDVLTTGPGSRLYIQFIDNTEFTLSENAQFTVEEYNFDEKNPKKNYATYSVLQGAFLYVSGLVAKKDNPDVKVNIPQGSIGIRGTKFWGGEVDGEYGVIVGEGKVTVKNKAGSATLVRGQGTTLKDRVTKPTAPKKWSPEKINKATATVALKDPVAVGARMVDARIRQAELRAEHAQAQAKVERIDPVVLEERVEQKILAIRPEMRPDLKGRVLENKTDDSSSLRDRLEQERLNSTSQTTVQERLNSTTQKDLSATATTTETTRTLSPVDQVLNDAKLRTESFSTNTTTADPGTAKTTTIIRETSDTVSDTGTRALTTTTETTTTVKDVVNDTVTSTSDTVQKVTETPIVKEVTTTTEKTLDAASQPVTDTVKTTTDTVRPATNTLKTLREQTLKSKQ